MLLRKYQFRPLRNDSKRFMYPFDTLAPPINYKEHATYSVSVSSMSVCTLLTLDYTSFTMGVGI